MAAITPGVSITAKAVESAVKRAGAGDEAEIKDATCRGLSLRLRGGRVTWTIRWKLDDGYKRWTIGAADVLPDEARRRAWHVKSCCQQGIDPTPQVIAWTTGVPIHKQPAKGVKSVSWETARKLFLDHIQRTRRPATHDDYRGILENTPELAAFAGRAVAAITEFNVATVLAEVSKRTEAHAEHVQRVLSSMWTFLASPENRPTTGVAPSAIRHVRAPERTRHEIGDPNAPAEADSAPPDRRLRAAPAPCGRRPRRRLQELRRRGPMVHAAVFPQNRA
jgi:Arm DNA-binding domain